MPSVTGDERRVLEALAELAAARGLDADLHAHDLARLRAHPDHPGEEAAREEHIRRFREALGRFAVALFSLKPLIVSDFTQQHDIVKAAIAAAMTTMMIATASAGRNATMSVSRSEIGFGPNAPNASCSSEPVPMRITFGAPPPGASRWWSAITGLRSSATRPPLHSRPRWRAHSDAWPPPSAMQSVSEHEEGV